MCVISKNSCSGFEEVATSSEIPLPTLYKHSLSYDGQISLEVCMPTLASHMKDYLVSTYELCEDG